MSILQPLLIRRDNAPPLPIGWSYLTTEDATTQLKPGPLFDKKTAQAAGNVPILSQGLSDFVGYHNEAPGVVANADRPVVTFANHTCAMRLMDRPFSCIQNIFPKIGKDGVADTRYFYYAALGRLNITDYKGHHPIFRAALIPIPPLETQRRIASILGAYDDLIEVNRRRVAVLEAMTRGLFEEWFVSFRFPGHENHKIINTPNGALPEGWRLGIIGDISKLRSGFAFKSASFVDGGQFGLVTIKHVQDGRLQPPFESRIDAIPNGMPTYCKISEGEMLLSLTGNVGRICLAWGDDLLLNQRVAKIEPTQKHFRAFAYGFLRLPMTRTILENNSNGAAQQNLSPVRTMELPCTVPGRSVAEAFEQSVGPVLDLIVCLNKAMANLAAARDLLLPRLISGELSVAAAESNLEAAA